MSFRDKNGSATCTRAGGSRAAVRVSLVDGDDGLVRFANADRVVLATDRPVAEYSYRIGRFLLALTLTKAAIKRWRDNGSLRADGNLSMLREHRQSVTDIIGVWEGLNVEPRDGFKALTATPAFSPQAMDAWFVSKGFNPGDWRAFVETNMLSRTSIGFSYKSSAMRERAVEIEGVKVFDAPIDGLFEASWVWHGQDQKAGTGRAEGSDMDPEELAALLAQMKETSTAATLAATAATDATRALSEHNTAATERLEREAAKPAELVAGEILTVDDSAQWQAAKTVFRAQSDLSVPERDAAIDKLEGESNRADTLMRMAAEAVTERSKKSDAPESGKAQHGSNASGGDSNIHRAAVETVGHMGTMFLARAIANQGDAPRTKEQEAVRTNAIADASAIRSDWRTGGDFRNDLILFGESCEILPRGYRFVTPGQLLRDLGAYNPKINFKALNSGRETIQCQETGGLWFVESGAIRDINGIVDVNASLRAGSGLSPGDFPALLASVVFKVAMGTYLSEVLPFESMSNVRNFESFTKQVLTMRDMRLPYSEVDDDQDLPTARVFDQSRELEPRLRGVAMDILFKTFFEDGGAQLFEMPADMMDAWAGYVSADWVLKLVSGLFSATVEGAKSTIYTGDRTATESDLEKWFSDINVASSKTSPVDVPSNVDARQSPRRHRNIMRPTHLAYGAEMDTTLTNFFANKIGGNAGVAGVANKALTSFMRQMRDNKFETAVIQDKTIIAFVGGGKHSAMSTGSVIGAPLTMSVTRPLGTNRAAPGMKINLQDTREHTLTGDKSAYRNVVP